MTTAEMTTSLRQQMQSIDPYEFEDFVAELWEDEGWETTVSQGSNDMGADVIATKRGTIDQQLVIQVKRYSDGNKVGRPQVQQYHSLKEQHSDADAAVVVTTSAFTDQARLWAHDHNVKLVDGDALVDMVRKHEREALVETYVDADATEPDADTSKSTDESDSTSTEYVEPESHRHRTAAVVVLAFGLEITGALLMFAPSLLPAVTAETAGLVGAFAWFVSPIAVFMDAHELNGDDTIDRTRNRIIWPAVAFMLGPIGLFWYLLKRF